MRVYHTLNNDINVQFDIRFCPKKDNANIRRGRDNMRQATCLKDEVLKFQ